MNYSSMIAIAIIIPVAAVVLYLLHKYLARSEARKKKRLEKWKDYDAIRTKSPEPDHIKEARKQSLQNLETRFNIIRRIIFPILIIILIVVLVIPFIGIGQFQASLLVAVTAAVVGIAARPYVENVISGVVITFSKTIRIGDTVLIDDNFGNIEDISLTHTTVKRWDWRRYVVPNARILNKEFLNYTLIDQYRWTYVQFYVSYDADLQLVEELAVDAARQSPHYAAYERPRFWIIEMEKEAIKCFVVGWVSKAADGWAYSVDVRKALFKSLQEHNIKTHTYLYNPSSSLRPPHVQNPGHPPIRPS